MHCLRLQTQGVSEATPQFVQHWSEIAHSVEMTVTTHV